MFEPKESKRERFVSSLNSLREERKSSKLRNDACTAIQKTFRRAHSLRRSINEMTKDFDSKISNIKILQMTLNNDEFHLPINIFTRLTTEVLFIIQSNQNHTPKRIAHLSRFILSDASYGGMSYCVQSTPEFNWKMNRLLGAMYKFVFLVDESEADFIDIRNAIFVLNGEQ